MSVSQRLLIYSKEQLEPVSRLLLSFLTALYIEVALASKFGFEPKLGSIVIPALSVFFLLVYYRVSDEFKDFETDKKFFPNRPIPSGRLFLTDLKWLLYLFAGLGLVLNLICRDGLVEFIVALVFTVAMGKWFFMEKLISKNRLLAFITHAPVGYLLYWYQIQYLLRVHDVSLSTGNALSVITFIVVPGFTWEILRKTYLAKDEMVGYQTYSSMLGFKKSLNFGSFWVFVTLINNFIMVIAFPVLVPIKLILLVLNLILFFIIEIHARKPLMPNLKRLVEIYMALHLLIPLVTLLRAVYGK